MGKTDIKAPVACRIPSELRQQLETEAAEEGQSLANYMASILENRNAPANAANSDESEAEMFGKLMEEYERAEALEAENAQLKAASKAVQVQQDNERILALKTQLAHNERQYQDLLQRHTRVATERDTLAKLPTHALPKWWSPEHYNETVPYIKSLSSKHPDYSAEQLLLSAVAVAAANEENSFFVYTLKDFWRRNPHFLNLQTPVATR
jgi:predicted DNA binding CopG/RHH family protein